MARLTPEQKALAKVDFEVNGMSRNTIAQKYNVGKATISRLAKKENWQQGKVEHLVSEKKNAIKTLEKVEHQMEHFEAVFQMAIDLRITDELKAEGIFVNSAIENQYLANKVLREAVENEEVNIGFLKTHSQIIQNNKETVLGKQPDTQFNIQNNADSITTLMKEISEDAQ